MDTSARAYPKAKIGLFAIGLAHLPDLFQLSESGGWAIELQAFFLFGALAVILLGPGRFSLQSPGSRWN